MNGAKKKSIVASVLALLICLSFATTALAAGYNTRTKTVTASPLKISFTLTYESYQDSMGRKLVRNGTMHPLRIDNISSDPLTINSVSTNLSLIDGGRTYVYSATIVYTQNGRTFTGTKSAEFSYV